MKRITKIVIASALTLGVAGGAVAHGKFRNMKDPSRMAAQIVNKVADKLDLDSTQTAALENLSGTLQSTRERMKAEMGDVTKEKMLDMITADTFDQAKAIDMVTAKTNLMQREAPAVIGALGGFLDTLTAEQKAEIAEHMKKHRKRGGKWRHGKGHGERSDG